MIRLVTRGRFTRDYAKGLVSAPEDREPIASDVRFGPIADSTRAWRLSILPRAVWWLS